MRHLMLMTAGIAAGIAALLLAPSTATLSTTSYLELDLPPATTAGEPLQIEVSAEPGAVVDLYFLDSYGTEHRRMGVDGDPAIIELPVTAAGRLDVVAVSGDYQITASTVVEPASGGPAPSPLVGARSIVADGVDRAMVVVIPADEFGNPTAGASSAAVTIVHPDGTRVIHSTQTATSLQWTWVPSVTTAGTAQLAVDLAGRRGPVRTLVEIPAAPEAFSLAAVTQLRPADGLTLVEVATTPLADRFGSRIVDGTAAVVTTRYGDGSESVQTAAVVGGVARAFIKAPDEPGIVHVRISIHGVTSPDLALDFVAALVPLSQASVEPLRLVPLGGGE